jgi:hypothetical protein
MASALSFALMLVAGAHAAVAADYAREERWAQEIVPAIVVGDAVYLSTVARPKILAIVTQPPGAVQGGIVVVHGAGVHPDWGLNGGLRTRLADFGYLTLSVQMPVLAAEAPRDDYRSTLPEAGDRIAAAIRYLRGKGIAKIAIVSHSMGATTVNDYLARPDAIAIDAWVPVGMFGAFAAPPKEPVLDIVAERDFGEVLAAHSLRAGDLPKDGCSLQVTIVDTDHYMDNRQTTLAATVAAFLARALSGSC